MRLRKIMPVAMPQRRLCMRPTSQPKYRDTRSSILVSVVSPYIGLSDAKRCVCAGNNQGCLAIVGLRLIVWYRWRGIVVYPRLLETGNFQ